MGAKAGERVQTAGGKASERMTWTVTDRTVSDSDWCDTRHAASPESTESASSAATEEKFAPQNLSCDGLQWDLSFQTPSRIPCDAVPLRCPGAPLKARTIRKPLKDKSGNLKRLLRPLDFESVASDGGIFA